MKNILDAPFLKEMMKTTANMYRLGWDERNVVVGQCFGQNAQHRRFPVVVGKHAIVMRCGLQVTGLRG